MKIRVLLKDPDTMHDAVDDAYKRASKPKPEVDDLTEQEWRDICEKRADDVKAAISSKWMEYGEYLEVEFDTDANTATVIPFRK